MENRHQYVDCIRSLRLKELKCEERVKVLLAGLSSVIPVHLLPLLTPLDVELRTCGWPQVDLDFLRVCFYMNRIPEQVMISHLQAHTMYQVGLMETDTHVQFFWQVLREFSQEELCRFIKFACNQERIPQTCPCRDGGADTAHVPPYPMKIAPPDGSGKTFQKQRVNQHQILFASGSPDSRFIRVETCMFMIKLPQYSTRELMRERLLYAIHCREDPLSG
jgi:E3 ubiquitin-protein ligase HECTD4